MNIIPLTPAGAPEFLRADALPLDVFRRALNDAVERADADGVDRADSGVASALSRFDSDGFFPEYLTTERVKSILAKPYPALDGLDAGIIPQVQFTGVGAEFTEVIRTDVAGEAAEYVGGGNIPLVDVSAASERFRVEHYVCGFRMSMFERQSIGNRIISLLDLRVNACRTIMGQRANRTVWSGSTSGLPGVFTHPWIPKRFGSVNWLTASIDSVIADVASLVHYASDATHDVGQSTKVVVASKLSRSLQTRRVTDTMGNLWTYLRSVFPGVTFVEAHSLNDAGPNGEHGVFAYNGGDQFSAMHDLVQPVTFLAPQTKEFHDVVFCYMTTGGFKAFNVHHDLLQWVPVT